MEEEELMINWHLVCLIFVAVLLSKLLSAWSSKLCDILTGWYISEPSELTNLRIQMTEMKQQLKQINMMENFADHARMQRRINKTTEELQQREQAHKSKRMKLNLMLSTTSTILTFVLRMGVVVYNRRIPVAVVPIEMFYPISSILAFPTGQPGGIGCPLWAVACSVSIDTATHWLKSLKT